MKPVHFPETKVVLAKNQPEYLPLPIHIRESRGSFIFTSCWKLSLIERVKVLFGGRIWCEQMVFHALQPQRLSIEKPTL